MWTRQELKQRGKTAFKRNYWKCVLAALVILFLTGASAAGSRSNSDSTFNSDISSISSSTGMSTNVVIAIFAGIAGVSLLISLLIWTFLRNPLLVGADRFFLMNAQGPAGIAEIGYSFGGGRYLKTVGAMFLSNLFCILWGLLLIVPGIMKAYDYYMVSYIMADDPDMTAMEALQKSKEMMYGHRWETFKLNLSFLGWHILGIITLNILEVFYVTPYAEATDAELYLTLKNL